MREFTIFFDYFYNTGHADCNLINLVRLNNHLVDEGILDNTRYYFYDEVIENIVNKLSKINGIYKYIDGDSNFNYADMGDMARIARAIEERCPNAKSCAYHNRNGLWYRCYDDKSIREFLYHSIFDACCGNYDIEWKVRVYTKLMIDCNKMTIF